MTALAQRSRKLSIPEFLSFYDTRPEEERWELIDGAALLMTPPFPAHQRIASNLERLLNDAFDTQGLPFAAFQRIGTELAEFPHYRPEPDIIVVDADAPVERRYFDRFTLLRRCFRTAMANAST
jgi:Uma2 family endonuclease